MVSGIRSSTGSYLATLVAGVLPSTLGFGCANLGFGCRSDDIVQKQMTNFEKMEVNYDSIYISNKPAAVRRVLMMSRYPMPLTNQTSETQQPHERAKLEIECSVEPSHTLTWTDLSQDVAVCFL